MDITEAHRMFKEKWSVGEQETPVMVQTPDGKLYDIKELVLEPREEDGEGNFISTGSTFFLKLEEY